MRDLRTATYTYVTLGPFIGSSDGYTIKNSLGSTAELISLVVDSDTGGLPTLAMDSVAGTTNGTNDFAVVAGCDAGFYSVELTTANTNYIGRGHIAVVNTTHLPVFEPVRLLPQATYDALYAGTSAGGVVDPARPAGTVLASTGAGNTVSLFKTDLAAVTADYYNNCLISFVDGNVAGQVQKITDYSTASEISVSTAAFTAIPTTGSAFRIINR
jgi:hypothetical protein